MKTSLEPAVFAACNFLLWGDYGWQDYLITKGSWVLNLILSLLLRPAIRKQESVLWLVAVLGFSLRFDIQSKQSSFSSSTSATSYGLNQT